MAAIPTMVSDSATILVTGDSNHEVQALVAMLDTTKYRVAVAENRDMAVAELSRRPFALLLHVLASAGANHLSTAHFLRQQTCNAATPLVLVAPTGIDPARAMRELGGGSVDCLEKPVDEFVLRAKVKMFVDMARNAARLRELEARERVNLTDALTGLPTRALMLDRTGQAIRQAVRGNGRVALGVLDLDQFQDVCETLGPASRDELLRQVALRLTGSLRRSDTVARIGDDEFAVVLACDTRDGVETVTTRLERAISEPFVVGEHRISVGGGIGVAMFPEHGRDPDVLLDKAVAAMNVAKQNSLGHLIYDPIEQDVSEELAATTVFEPQELRVANGS